MDLDHLALGLRAVGPALDALVGDLGAVVLDGGQSVGFRIVQVRLGRPRAVDGSEDPGEGMTVELMEPWAVERFDFLVRFLDSRGEGPHHMTFTTADLQATLDRLAAAGFEPVRVQMTNPWWREAFFHPAQTFGTVIQLADATFREDLLSEHDPPEGEFGSIEWWPSPAARRRPGAVLRRVVLGAPEVGEARDFFSGLLGGEPDGDGRDLVWPGGGRIHVEERPGRPPGIDRLECEWDGPPGEREVGGARFVLKSVGD